MISDISKLCSQQKYAYQDKIITVQPQNQNCSILKISIKAQTDTYVENISVIDVIDVRKALKEGKKLKNLNQMSLLFIKLIIQKAVKQNTLTILELKDVPLNKIIRNNQKMQLQVQNGKKDESIQIAKCLALYLRPDFIIIVPRTLKKIPDNSKSLVSQSSDSLIKKIFFDDDQKLTNFDFE